MGKGENMSLVTGEDPDQQYWLAGYNAYNNGDDEDANPYEDGSFEFECWNDGFEDAQEDEAQKV